MTTDQLGRVVDAWRGLNYSARGSVQRCAPTLANALNDAADRAADRAEAAGMVDAGQRALAYLLDGPEPSASAVEIGRQFAEQAQPLPPVDNVAGCAATDLGRRCVRLADHEDGHLFPPTVPAGSDRFA